MAELLVRYTPHPIRWNFHKDTQGKQIDAGRAHVNLIVRAVDKETLVPVEGRVTSIPIPPPFGDDPNNLDFNTNELQNLTLVQATSTELPHGVPPFVDPEVQVTANGYETVSLVLT